MPEEPQKKQAKMIGYDILANMSDPERAQAVWDKAVKAAGAEAWFEDYFMFKAGKGPYPGKYNGPVIDFEQADADLEKEEPEGTEEPV